ncbi:Hypothetical predicted protein [Marmota monax]|uniref:Uncharacterized protein n=1 Tax=Marmota monax TaxID=9995 RepID=A0A5E4B3A9_MARMO|nr:Hypothetical predicted protein [Marmota monax]
MEKKPEFVDPKVNAGVEATRTLSIKETESPHRDNALHTQSSCLALFGWLVMTEPCCFQCRQEEVKTVLSQLSVDIRKPSPMSVNSRKSNPVRFCLLTASNPGKCLFIEFCKLKFLYLLAHCWLSWETLPLRIIGTIDIQGGMSSHQNPEFLGEQEIKYFLQNLIKRRK